MNANKQFWWCL